MEHAIINLTVDCPSFHADGQIPRKHTGFGEDISPEIVISGLRAEVASIAILMDDLDIPVLGRLNHWVIWNIPATSRIPENMPKGSQCPNGAVQGVGYGKNGYRGPKQPPFIRKAHRYVFAVYGLDCALELPSTSRKADVLKAMDGHILQKGTVIGWYKP